MEKEKKILILILHLQNENRSRAIALNDKDCSEYSKTVLTHKYNNTLEIVKRLTDIMID